MHALCVLCFLGKECLQLCGVSDNRCIGYFVGCSKAAWLGRWLVLAVPLFCCYTEKSTEARHRLKRQHNACANRKKQCRPRNEPFHSLVTPIPGTGTAVTCLSQMKQTSRFSNEGRLIMCTMNDWVVCVYMYRCACNSHNSSKTGAKRKVTMIASIQQGRKA